jgi:Flp pilus assembly protein TadD
MDIEPLLVRLEALAPSFGRAQDDIRAMVSRGRSEDYKGVMQNCRLVLEALLRALVSDQLKQTPGKAMLDELITKFRQQANAGLIPTNVLAHMGTVQAWGNLSSHDHATKLSDDKVTVGKGEVMASLNSMVAILDWYAGAFGTPLARAVNLPPTVSLRPPPGPAKKSPAAPLTVAAIVLAAAGLGGYFAIRAAPVVKADAPVFAALDALYLKWDEPLPPGPCRSPSEAPILGSHCEELTVLEALPTNRSAEAWYLVARAQTEQKLNAQEALDQALGCPGFAAALNLAGRIAVLEQRFDDATPKFIAALEATPNFHKARFNLGMLHLTQGRLADGERELKKVTTARPKYGDAHFGLGMFYDGQNRKEEAKAEFCLAVANGSQIKMARVGCER